MENNKKTTSEVEVRKSKVAYDSLEWDSVIPLKVLKAPVFPVNSLPPNLRKYIIAMSDFYACEPGKSFLHDAFKSASENKLTVSDFKSLLAYAEIKCNDLPLSALVSKN